MNLDREVILTYIRSMESLLFLKKLFEQVNLISILTIFALFLLEYRTLSSNNEWFKNTNRAITKELFAQALSMHAVCTHVVLQDTGPRVVNCYAARNQH